MASLTTAFWSFTINNPTKTDDALIQQGYPDHIRQLVYEREVGEEGTPHIQGYLRLYRQQRLSYVKKLFPRAKFFALTSDEYHLNSQRYAQKQDETATGPAVINNNPFPDPVKELLEIIEKAYMTHGYPQDYDQVRECDFMVIMREAEEQRVFERTSLVKFYVSSTYIQAKKQFWRPLLRRVIQNIKDGCLDETHTHTHTQPELFSQQVNIPTFEDGEDDGDEGQDAQGSTESGEDCEDNEDSESSEDEGYSEGGSVSDCTSDDCSDDGE